MRALVPGLLVLGLLAGELPAQLPKKSDVPRLIKELRQSDNSKVRTAAAESLGALGAVRTSYVKDAIEPLAEAVTKDRHSDVRAAAATALGAIRPDAKVAVPPLTEALKDKTPAVKIAAAVALTAFGPEARQAVPLLEELAKDKNKKVSQAAKEAMKSIGK
jgi:HEAT repeat protein